LLKPDFRLTFAIMSQAPSPDPTDPSEQPRPGRLLEIEPAALSPARKGRGARVNPSGRFERQVSIADLDARQETRRNAQQEQDEALSEPGPKTLAIPDSHRTAIVFNQSPDIPFDASLNPYRGCEHGCAYCYARPTHEYLGYSAGLDFETKILVKERAPEMLRRELSASRWQPQVVALSGVTDAYQPLERELGLTRRCVEVLAEFRNPITVITKNALVTRDLDLFRKLAEHDAVSVSLSLTTLDPALGRALEPRASAPHERLRAIERLAEAGIPTGVMIAPIIPGLTDAETPALLEAAASAGAGHAGHIVLRLPHGLKDLFDDWLLTHRPLRRMKVLHRLESLRGGRLNDPRFGTRMRGEGRFAEQIGDLFRIWARKYALDRPLPPLSTAAFRRPGGTQLCLGLD
jgi:DNA repair photolyase